MLNGDYKSRMLRKSVCFGSKLCEYTREFAVVEVDDEYAELTGFSPEEKEMLVGKTMYDCIHPGDVEQVAREVLQREERSYECQYRLKKNDGTYIWVRDAGEVVEIDGVRYVQSTVVDIDEREKLRKQRDITNDSLPGGVVFVVIGQDNFYIREGNRQFFDSIGVDRKEYLSQNVKYTFPEDLPKLREHLVERGQKHAPVDFEFRTRTEDAGNVRWFQVMGNYYESREDGEEYLCLMLDITDRKMSQFDLIKEKEKYRMAMKNTADLMYEYDVRNEKLSLFGYNYMTEETQLCVENDMKIGFWELLCNSDLIYQGDRRKIISFLKNGMSCYENIRMLTKDQKTKKKYYDNYEVYLNKVWNNGELERIIGYVKKISYKTIPVTTKQELHQIFDEHILKDYSFILKIDVPTESFTSYFIEDLGWENYRGNRYYDSFLYWWCKNMIVPEEQRELNHFLSLEQMLRILHSGEPSGYRFCTTFHQNEQKRKYKICTFSFYGSDVNTIILIVRDVHAIRAEEQYQEKANQKILTDVLAEAKMAGESRKKFLDYIIRELSDPIMAIKEFVGEEPCEEGFKKIERCIAYMREMIESTREYNQLESLNGQPEPRINLYDLCREVCEEERKISLGLDISIKEHISISKERKYYINKFRFKEILVNLLGNAIKYAPKGSEIVLHAKEERIDSNKYRIDLIVEDEGPVINAQFFARQLDENYDYDIRDKMIALGGVGDSISLASKISGLLGGEIEFRQGVIYNSVVQVCLPVYASELDFSVVEVSDQKKEKSPEVDLGGQGILLVQHENSNNDLTAPLLRVNGAKVYAATSGEEAIRLLDRFGKGGITAILTDQELSDMNCYELAKKIKYTKNHNLRKIPVIEMLEGIQTDDTRLSLLSGINATITKPISLSKLAIIIENLQQVT